MLLLAFALIIFFFLCIGSLVFIASILLPQPREHALSAALWCAMWGPCIVVLLTLAGLGLFGTSLAQEHGHLQLIEHLLSTIGTLFAILGFCGTFIVASLVAWIHQWIIHRMTFFLFRIYACLVVAGIGSVWGWAINFWLLNKGYAPMMWGLAGVILLSLAFGYAGFRWARQLRGDPPQNFTWISPEEFKGNA